MEVVALLLLALAVALSPRPAPPNPVYSGDFPDPFVLAAAQAYYAYGTNVFDNVQLLESRDLAAWRRLPDAMPALPSWAAKGRTWAPSVLERNGRWVLYFAAHHAASGLQCVGRAVAAVPTGPFVDDSAEPLLCRPQEKAGAIDASPFVDRDGTPYLLWSDCCRPPLSIWSQKLSPDGLSLAGMPQRLIGTDQAWEGPLVEAPSMLHEAGRYHLLYSGNRWQSEHYAIGIATCEGPLGPCRKAAAPLLSSAGAMAGPGGQEFFRDRRGDAWIAYHAWTAPKVSYASKGARSLRLERLRFVDGELALEPRAD